MSFVKYVAIPLNYFDLLKGSAPKSADIKEDISEPVQVQIVDNKKEVAPPAIYTEPKPTATVPVLKAKPAKRKKTIPTPPPPGVRDKPTGWIIP